MKRISLLSCCIFLSVVAQADPYAAVPSHLNLTLVSDYGAGLEYRRAGERLAYTIGTDFKDKRLHLELSRYNSESFLTNGITAFTEISVGEKANTIGAKAFNEGSSYFFSGMLRHQFTLGAGFSVQQKEIYPLYKVALTPRFFNVGLELSYQYNRLYDDNQHILGAGLVYLW